MRRMWIVMLCASAAFAQVAETANKQYQTKEGRAAVGKGLPIRRATRSRSRAS